MARQQPYALIFDPQVKSHLSAIPSKYHSLIRATIQEQLLFQPESETRNRKVLQPPAALGATWELRFGPDNRYRVLYTTNLERREVLILAIGIKEGNRLIIGGEEVVL